ncbi:orotidine-5'-phosphate decarboxylase [Marivirga atlantica]|jgi:orotidine-5'-phosphate decarboxylase|uniref:Orotidine 5'-phosphate decarboxylase n=1 Tax=Marivirga atlantica TaxID=1548457 RepID=A0A937AHC2_9BACT|nr:orotidine-5'-phosphate decarboxylase [Marivirga atlantica]MBL0766756.1 orotidine-5'-phosphate decarboxylase [Marivirga atlantica]
MTKQEIIKQIFSKKSYLCVGLDTDINKIPSHLKSAEDPIFEFNKQIIDATYEYAVAYKPNIAFYEAHGPKGWESLQKTIEYIPDDIFTIADAKRGDIGNTSKMYARAFFEQMNFDSITVAPYMGSDSVEPFLEFENKWVILLALTSNQGSKDFQYLKVNDQSLFEEVLQKSQDWGDSENMMYVVGATRTDQLEKIRKSIPNHFLLVPGVGAQGGNLSDVSEKGLNKDCGLLVNSSRGIIYASDEKNFAQVAAQKAKSIQEEMEGYLAKWC